LPDAAEGIATLGGACHSKACLMVKHARSHFHPVIERVTDGLELVHAHICGPLPKSLSDKGRFCFVLNLRLFQGLKDLCRTKEKPKSCPRVLNHLLRAPRVTSSLVRYKSKLHQQLFTCTKGPFLQYNRYAKRQYPPSLLPLPASVHNRCLTHNYASSPWELISSGGHIHSRTTVAFGGTQFRNDVNAASGCTRLVPRIMIGVRFFKSLVQKTRAYPLCMALINFGLVCSGKRMVT
jgi:hypothetical protein